MAHYIIDLILLILIGLNKVHAIDKAAWLASELETTNAKIDAFTAGHFHVTSKPERTPGMP
jgi:hypothetical protein